VPEYVSIDLETTGLDSARDRVIEVGAVAFTPDHTLATLERLVDPQRPLPESVARLTGISQADLKGAASAGCRPTCGWRLVTPAVPWPMRVAFFRGHDDELVELPEDKTGYT